MPSTLAPGARALMRAVYVGVAAHDREEFLAAMRAAKERRWSGGKIPYGCALKTEKLGLRAVKRIVPEEERKQTVLEIFTLYSEGKTQADIASLLNARGAPHPDDRVASLHWHQSTISVILRNPVYKGEGQWRRRYEKGKSRYNSSPEQIVRYEDYQLPAIVPVELWDLAQRWMN